MKKGEGKREGARRGREGVEDGERDGHIHVHVLQMLHKSPHTCTYMFKNSLPFLSQGI